MFTDAAIAGLLMLLFVPRYTLTTAYKEQFVKTDEKANERLINKYMNDDEKAIERLKHALENDPNYLNKAIKILEQKQRNKTTRRDDPRDMFIKGLALILAVWLAPKISKWHKAEVARVARQKERRKLKREKR